jgi:hypothetical protein
MNRGGLFARCSPTTVGVPGLTTLRSEKVIVTPEMGQSYFGIPPGTSGFYGFTSVDLCPNSEDEGLAAHLKAGAHDEGLAEGGVTHISNCALIGLLYGRTK